MLGVNSRAKRGVMQHLVHVQTNASVDSSELLQSYWNADSPSLTVAGPSCHADSPLCYGVRSRPPLSMSRRQLLSAPLSNPLSSRVPLPLPDPARIQVQNPLSGFAPKQTKESSAWRATYIVLHYSHTHIHNTNISGNIVNNNNELQWTNEHTSL